MPKGVYERKPLEVRFWEKVEPTGFCWNWIGAINSSGYGSVRTPDGIKLSHRVSYELLVGPLLKSDVIDHLCRNRACVNPDHLDVTTNKVNVLRGFGPSAVHARQDTCKKGHELEMTPAGRRFCRTCAKEAYKRYNKKRPKRAQ